MKRGKPVNMRPGRMTVVTLPSGEVVALEPEREKGHLLLRISAPEGSQIDHRKTDEATAQQNGPAVGQEPQGLELPRLPGARIRLAEAKRKATVESCFDGNR